MNTRRRIKEYEHIEHDKRIRTQRTGYSEKNENTIIPKIKFKSIFNNQFKFI